MITVEYWPHTGTWRILVAGVAVGYWPTQDEAEMRARQARRALAAQASADEPSVCANGAHRVSEALCDVSGCAEKRSGQSRYCKRHDMRYRRHGDPAIILKPWGRKKDQL